MQLPPEMEFEPNLSFSTFSEVNFYHDICNEFPELNCAYLKMGVYVCIEGEG